MTRTCLPPDPLPGLDDVEGRHTPVLRDITVVVPTLGRSILENVLASLVGGTAWPARIIVVDQSDGSDVEGMLARVEALGARTLRLVSTPRGKAAALNLGIREVGTPYFAITDDDCVPDSEWLSRMRAALEEHADAIVSGTAEDVGEAEAVAVVRRDDYEVRTRPDLRFDLMVGGNFGMARTLFDRVGPFDEDLRLRLSEDTEYAYRALRKGCRLAFVPDVVVWHYAWRDPGQRDRQFRGYAHSHGAFYGKYIRSGDAFIALRAILHLARAGRRWARSAWRGDANEAANGRAYVLGLLPGIVAGARRPSGRGVS